VSPASPTPALDRFDARRAREAPDLLRPFNDAGVLAAADIHVARRLAALTEEDDPAVLLAIALAVRAPRLGHVYVDLADIATTASVDTEDPVDLAALPWPSPGSWSEAVAGSAAVAVDEDDEAVPAPGGAGDDDRALAAVRPLRLSGTRLYLDRYWREERRLAADLHALAEAGSEDGLDLGVLADGLHRLFRSDDDPGQRLAAASAVLRRFAVVAGGPGTGKTSTVARIVALLYEQADERGAPLPLVALAAPTGKAAARLAEAVHEEAAELAIADRLRNRLGELTASTLHRLLGWRPDSDSRFRHHRGNRLPHDVVIVDETSMVSLSLMARLVEAVRPDARLILVGDPGQLTSIEAGAVLGDIVGPAEDGLLLRPDARRRLAEVTGVEVDAGDPPSGSTVGDGIVVLRRGYRFGRGIARVARAVRDGDGDAAVAVLEDPPEGVTWIALDAGDPEAFTGDGALAAVRGRAVETGRAVHAAALAGDAPAALEALRGFRLLCAHRRGPYGVSTWMATVEGWLAEAIEGFGEGGPWYPGRPLLITDNDYGLRLFNGDTGVVVAGEDGRVTAVFDRGEDGHPVAPSQLEAVETVHAMTIHKSQGSQFSTAAVLLPEPGSPILTRELLYTAVTRAQDELILVGTAEMVRTAVGRPVARASGLRERLWRTGSG
jgi:exodeoxyribonuclease V alpha subunit